MKKFEVKVSINGTVFARDEKELKEMLENACLYVNKQDVTWCVDGYKINREDGNKVKKEEIKF